MENMITQIVVLACVAILIFASAFERYRTRARLTVAEARIDARKAEIRSELEKIEAMEDRLLRQPVVNLSRLEHTVNHLTEKSVVQDQINGGVWKMANGVLIAVRQMSDGHLKNCLKGFAKGSMATAMRDELARRETDLKWRDIDDGAQRAADMRYAKVVEAARAQEAAKAEAKADAEAQAEIDAAEQKFAVDNELSAVERMHDRLADGKVLSYREREEWACRLNEVLVVLRARLQ